MSSAATVISEVDACKSVVVMPKAKITKLSRPRLGAAPSSSHSRTQEQPKFQEAISHSSHDRTPSEVQVQAFSHESADYHDDCVSVLTTPTVINTRGASPLRATTGSMPSRGLNSVPSSVGGSAPNSRSTADFYPNPSNPSRPTLVRGTTSQNHAPFTAAGDVVTDSYRNLMRQKYARPATRAPLIPKPQQIFSRSATIATPSRFSSSAHMTVAAPDRTATTPRRTKSNPGPTKPGLANNRVTMHKVPDWREGPEPTTQEASAARIARRRCSNESALSADTSGYHSIAASSVESTEDSLQDFSSQEMQEQQQQSSPPEQPQPRSEGGRQFVAKAKAPCAPLQMQKSKKGKKSKSKKSWLPSFGSSKKECKRSMIFKASADAWQT